VSKFRAAAKAIRRMVAPVRQTLRRQRDRYFPDLQTRQYRIWISRQSARRNNTYNAPVPPGLLSIVTAVWDGSPVAYLRALADSIACQNPEGECEWVVLDNGCSRNEVLDCLHNLKRRYSWIRIYRSEENVGILRGLRLCLERASGRYVLPVDGDDRLYPDALKIVAAHLARAGYPPILYTDEDKVAEAGVSQPYFKPDWDPVLLANLAYIAHLGVVNREEALRLRGYSDPATEGSPDWDLFLRFAAAGHAAVHIPEVVYSWRMHASSTAEDAHSKSYIMTSQQAVLANFLAAKSASDRFSIENSPFFPGAPHWHFVRRHRDKKAITFVMLKSGTTAEESGKTVATVELHSDPRALLSLASEVASRDELLCFMTDDLVIENEDWEWEAIGLFELFPDTAMVGGRIRNAAGEILEAGLQLGYRGLCGSPDRGRQATDPGYFGQTWKQRSVSAVSLQCAVLKPQFLLEALAELPDGASLPLLGAWLGAHALRRGQRVVYTPFLGGVTETTWDGLVTEEERDLFLSLNREILPDRRYYPTPLSLEQGYMLSDDGAAAS
jgi:glycosyltransferase involved in cell wall biosynthesis